MSDGKVTHEGKHLIERWQAAQMALGYAKKRVTTAECELANATNALGKWMLPNDVKPGEKLCVWYGDSMIQVENVPSRIDLFDYIITVRVKGDALR